MNLQDRIVRYISSNTPVTVGTSQFCIEDLDVVMPDMSIDNQLKMKYTRDESLEALVRGRLVVKDVNGNVLSKGQKTTIVKCPVLTDRHTYLINGNEKSVLAQMRLKPGCYTTKDEDRGTIKTSFMFSRNANTKYMPIINLNIKTGASPEFTVEVKKGGFNCNIVNFLWILGFSDVEISKALGNGVFADSLVHRYAAKKTFKSPRELLKILAGVSTELLTDNQARQSLWDFFNDNAHFDSEVINENIGVKSNTFNKDIVFKAVQKASSVLDGTLEPDVKDDIKFKDIYSGEDLIFDKFCEDFNMFLESSKTKLETNKTVNANDFRKLTNLGNGIKDFFTKSELVQSSDQINPLMVESESRKITQFGEGGMGSDSSRNEVNARNLTQSAMNKLDPIETPESNKIGLAQHLAQGVKIEDKTIKMPVFRVFNGVADKASKIDLTPLQEEKAIVAYYDLRYMEDNNGKIKFTKAQIPCRYLGENKTFPVSQVQYVDTNSNNVLGTAANMIPFVMHNDGARALMGANMQKQAINIIHREAPLVDTVVDKDTGETYSEKLGREQGKPVSSSVDGTVTAIEKNSIVVTGNDGKKYPHTYYFYYPLNMSFINNELKVKVGDKVTKGQLLAEGWQTDNGKLALGRNARIGYLPYKGYNYEDGVVISDSFSKAMVTEEMDEFEILIPKNATGGMGSNVLTEAKKYTTDAYLTRLNKDGIIKEGEYVKPGNVVAVVLKPLSTDDSSIINRIMATDKDMKYALKPIAIPGGSYVEGKIVRIVKIDNPDTTSSQKIILTLVKNKPLKQGDKVSGRHGNKGTVTKILPDNQMPVAEDGRKFDLLFSPLAVPSRKNLGQVFEVNAGLVAEKTGKSFKVDNFDHNEKERVLKELENIGYKDGKMKVTLKEEDENGNIIDVPVENPITVGNMYIMKLKHKVDDKIQGRNNLDTNVSMKEYMPSKTLGASSGDRHNPQSMGEMEMRALQGHGAVWNLLESTTIKSDGGGDQTKRIAMFKALSTGKLDGEELSGSATPESLKVLCDDLKTLGLNVKPMYNDKEVGSLDKPFNSLGIAPLNTNEFMRSVGEDKEVFKHTDLYNSRALYGDNGNSISSKNPEIEGGLVDPNIFGEQNTPEARDKWGYIKLATPMPNPLFMKNSSYNVYSLMTGIKKEKLQSLFDGKSVVIGDEKEFLKKLGDLPTSLKNEYLNEFRQSLELIGKKPGDIVDVKVLDKELTQKGLSIPTKAGSDFLFEKLSEIDSEKGLEEAKEELKNAKTASDIDKAYKKVRTFENLVKNNMEAKDFMMTCVPVMPMHLRPVTLRKEDRSLTTSDINKLYSNTIQANQNVKKAGVTTESGFIDFTGAGMTPIAMAGAVSNIYKSISDLNGQTQGKEARTKKDLIGLNSEIGGKDGLVRSKLLSKRLDFSGRSVIGVDPNLKLNEVGLPLDMAKQMYKPFIIKELVDRGYAKNESAASDMIKKSTPEVKKIAQIIANDRPILINRQPSLHKFSLQALNPIVKDSEDGSVVRSMHLNPLVVTGFNADFDGDTMAAHIPLTEKAKEEAKKLMMPSQNLINPTDGKLIIELRHEMLLGIYQLTNKWDKPVGREKSYMTKRELLNDYLYGKIGAYQKVKVPINPTPVTAGQALMNWTIPEKIKGRRNFKIVWNKSVVSKFFTQLYKDSEATNFKLMSKLEISELMDDLKDLGFKASTRTGVSIGPKDFVHVEEIDKLVAEATKKGVTIDNWGQLENTVQKAIANGALPSDNPLQVMMSSGARASADQIRRMAVTVGRGFDVTKTMRGPIKESHFDGISAKDFFIMGYDSRKGMYDRAVSTAEPGALARDVWSAVQDVTIKEADCKTKEFISVKKTDQGAIKGRYAGAEIRDKDGKIICKKDTLITNELYTKISNDDTIQFVPVRSPLRCKTIRGVCQKCYGTNPGTMQPVKIGTAIGVLASQAIGEPVTQMTMNTFHSGGTNSSATLGLPRVKKILNLGSDSKNGAVIVETAGRVESINTQPMALEIVVGRKTYKIPKDINGKLPDIKVKVGDMVEPGDFLTVGDTDDVMTYMNDKSVDIVLTNADPKKLFKNKAKAVGQEKALGYTQDYLTNSMQYAFTKTVGNDALDRKHMETIVSKLTENAMILDPGDSKFTKGQVVDIAAIQKYNDESSMPFSAKVVPITNVKDLVDRVAAENIVAGGKVVIKKGELITTNLVPTLMSVPSKNIKVMPKQIQFEMQLKGKQGVDAVGHDNWFSNLGGQNVYKQLARGGAFGQVDKLQDPRARLMAGKMLNIGEGANIPNQVKNSISSKMMNFFGNNIDNLIDKYTKKK